MFQSPTKIGLFQATGLVVYVGTVATILNYVSQHHLMAGVAPVIDGGLFLLLFVISALTCGAVALGYPATLFFADKKKEALSVVGWTLAFLVIYFAVLGGIAFLIVGF